MSEKPCTRCGKCCIVGLCEPAQMIINLGEPDMPTSGVGPCPFLTVEEDGQIACKIVVAERRLPEQDRLITKGLGIGIGCNWPESEKSK